MTVLVYVNTSKQVGDVDYIKVFATTDAAETWFEENDGIRVSGVWNCYRVKESDMGFRFSAPKPNRKKVAPASFQCWGRFQKWPPA
jgi:hypothetical protein